MLGIRYSIYQTHNHIYSVSYKAPFHQAPLPSTPLPLPSIPLPSAPINAIPTNPVVVRKDHEVTRPSCISVNVLQYRPTNEQRQDIVKYIQKNRIKIGDNLGNRSVTIDLMNYLAHYQRMGSINRTTDNPNHVVNNTNVNSCAKHIYNYAKSHPLNRFHLASRQHDGLTALVNELRSITYKEGRLNNLTLYAASGHHSNTDDILSIYIAFKYKSLLSTNDNYDKAEDTETFLSLFRYYKRNNTDKYFKIALNDTTIKSYIF